MGKATGILRMSTPATDAIIHSLLMARDEIDDAIEKINIGKIAVPEDSLMEKLELPSITITFKL